VTASPSRSQLIGGRYRLDRRLGEGGMGIVWAATHVESGRTVALKMLKPHARTRPDHQRRLLREARAAGAVKHPNVVKIHEVFESDDDGPVIVMDLLEGETLRAKLGREERLSVAEAASIMLPVVSAVAAAHAEGVVHRDLKPDNIFLRNDVTGSASTQVLDFGIAKLVLVAPELTDSSGLTHTGAMLGTPWYMAPEQGFGERDVDARADIWALGVILYESLSGGRPVEGENLGQVLKRLTSQGITPLSRVAPDVPEDVATAVDRMLAIEKDERLSDLGSVRTLLERYSGMHDPAGPPRPAGSKARRRRAYMIALGALALAVGTVWAVRPRPSVSAKAEASNGAAPRSATPSMKSDSTGVKAVLVTAPSVGSAASNALPTLPGTTSVTVNAHAHERASAHIHRRTASTSAATDSPPAATTSVAAMPAMASPSPAASAAPNTILGGLAAHPPF
jgi:serine/threonine-protein kinase